MRQKWISEAHSHTCAALLLLNLTSHAPPPAPVQSSVEGLVPVLLKERLLEREVQLLIGLWILIRPLNHFTRNCSFCPEPTIGNVSRADANFGLKKKAKFWIKNQARMAVQIRYEEDLYKLKGLRGSRVAM